MELRHLRYFVAVAQELSFTRAAARLGTAQPSLSQQIIQLERHVGTPLLARTKRTVRLTPAGRIFFREAQDILARSERATALAADAGRGHARELSIGMMPAVETTILPKLLPLLERRLPKVRIALHSLGSYGDQLARLRSHAIDLAFLWGPLDEPDLVVNHLYSERLVVVLPAGHRLAGSKKVTVQQLADVPCIVPAERASPPLRAVIAELFTHARAPLRPRPDADNVLGHLNMVRAGLGFAILPEYVRAILPHGVVSAELDWTPEPTIAVVLAHLKDGQLPVVSRFKRVLKEALGDREPARGRRRR